LVYVLWIVFIVFVSNCVISEDDEDEDEESINTYCDINSRFVVSIVGPSNITPNLTCILTAVNPELIKTDVTSSTI
jgi:hypothetical protein